MATTLMSMQTATEKDSQSSLELRLRKPPSDLCTLNQLFSDVWEVIRGGRLFAGQPRTSASARCLALGRMALQAANRSRNSGLIGEAHRMIAYALNANEQYSDSIEHYSQAITALEGVPDETGCLVATQRIIGFLG